MGAQPQRTTIIGRYALPDSTPVSKKGSAGAANSIVLAANPNVAYHVTAFDVTVSDATNASAITVTISDGSTVICWEEIIPSGTAIGVGVGRVFTSPLIATVGNALTLAASAGGTGCVTIANLAYFPE